jgi:hypothetical protein
MIKYPAIKIANKISKIKKEISESPKLIVIIAILLAIIIIFIVKYDSRSMLEKCADEKHALGKRESERLEYIIMLKGMSLKEKSENSSYLFDFQHCENLKLKAPETFKLQYGR